MRQKAAAEKAELFANYGKENATCNKEGPTKVENVASTATPEEEEEAAPWKAFHASYMIMRAEGGSCPDSVEPEKVADKALKQMEKSMKSWEDRMMKGAKKDVEVTDDVGRLLKGGYLETVVCFTSDSDELSESQEAVLRTVAATIR